MTDRTFIANSRERLDEAVAELRRRYEESRYVEVTLTVGERKRTSQQNRALWLWYRWLSEELNERGLDMRVVIRDDVDIPWSPESVHQYIWKPVQKAMLGKESTTEANRTEYSDVRDVIARHLQERFDIAVPTWPSMEREGAA